MEKSATEWMIEPLRKYANFTGRARRKEYWWFQLFVTLLIVVLSIIDGMVMMGAERMMETGGFGPLVGIAALGLILPSIGVSVRRLHDRDKSGWFILVGLIPLIGGLIMLYWYVQRGTIGENRFGPDPVGA